jgi:hypothetical protein
MDNGTTATTGVVLTHKYGSCPVTSTRTTVGTILARAAEYVDSLSDLSDEDWETHRMTLTTQYRYHLMLSMGAGSVWLGGSYIPQNTVPRFALTVNLSDDSTAFQAGTCPMIHFPKGPRRATVTPRSFTRDVLRKVSARINAVVESGGAVLIFCETGDCKAAAMLAAYIMWKYHTASIPALNYVKALRETVNVTMEYQQRLEEQLARS